MSQSERPMHRQNQNVALVRFLISLRVSSKLSQAEIGRALGMSQPDISKIERLERRIDAIECLRWLVVTSDASHTAPDHAWHKLYDLLMSETE